MKRHHGFSFSLAFVLVAGCEADPIFEEVPQSEYERFAELEAGFHTLFGLPPSNGPIRDACCMPAVAHRTPEDGRKIWRAPRYTVDEMRSLYDDWVLVEAWPLSDVGASDADFGEDLLAGLARFCAVHPRPELQNGEGGPMPYDLVDFLASEEAYSSEEAEASAQGLPDGAMVTHRGRCGACSSLRNLAVYISNNNLSDPIRACAMAGLFDRDLSRLACIASLGFDLPCAKAWEINTEHTEERCVAICGRPNNRKAPGNKAFECKEDGVVPEDIELVNDCLACDELFSLELFREKAGRSRRGSGLPTPICRRSDRVFRIVHRYERGER